MRFASRKMEGIMMAPILQNGSTAHIGERWDAEQKRSLPWTLQMQCHSFRAMHSRTISNQFWIFLVEATTARPHVNVGNLDEPLRPPMNVPGLLLHRLFSFLLIFLLCLLSGAIFRRRLFSSLSLSLSLFFYSCWFARLPMMNEHVSECVCARVSTVDPIQHKKRKGFNSTGIMALELGWYLQFKCVRIFCKFAENISHEFHNSHLKWLRNFGVSAQTAMVRVTHINWWTAVRCVNVANRTFAPLRFFFRLKERNNFLDFILLANQENAIISLFLILVEGLSEVKWRCECRHLLCDCEFNALARSTQLKGLIVSNWWSGEYSFGRDQEGNRPDGCCLKQKQQLLPINYGVKGWLRVWRVGFN